MNTLYVIDGSGFIFRAFHALPPLESSTGEAVGAIYGFCTMVVRLLLDKKPGLIGVAFDTPQKTFRHELYTLYKAHRPAPAPELVAQFAGVRRACEVFGLPILETPGVEADDVIASYAVEAVKHGYRAEIIASDKDFMQLIGPGITMYDPLKKRLIGEEEVVEKWGVTPEEVVQVQALMGDSTDNIPGVPGVGPKTASEWIARYKTVANLLEHAKELPPSKRRDMLIAHKEQALLSLELARLKTDVPLERPLESLKMIRRNDGELDAFLSTYEFHTLRERLIREHFLRPVVQELPALVQEPLTPQTLPLLEAQAELSGTVALTWGVSHSNAKMGKEKDAKGGEGRGDRDGDRDGDGEGGEGGDGGEGGEGGGKPHGFWIGLWAGESGKTLFTLKKNLSEMVPLMLPFFSNARITKIVHDGKGLLKHLHRYSPELTLVPMHDLLLLSYVIYGGHVDHSLASIAQRLFPSSSPLHYCDHASGSNSGGGGNSDGDGDGDGESGSGSGALVQTLVQACWQAYPLLSRELEKSGSVEVYSNLEKPLIPVLARMEEWGIRVDPQKLHELSASFEERLAVLEAKIFELSGETFNIASPKQLGEVLFEKLGWPSGKRGKSGAFQTSADVLERFAREGRPLAELLLEWRHLSKLKSTYSDALVRQISPEDQRIHTTYAMAETTTGRLSSLSPNLQNIPARTAEGKLIRNAFVAEKGYIFISLDYSQIELRLLAHIAHVPQLVEAFFENRDIHLSTAMDVFGLPAEQVTDDHRRQAKTINFGILYGMSAFGLAQQLSLARAQAQRYIDRYFQTYPGIHAYIEQTLAYGREHGFVRTLWGRRCFIPGLLSSHRQEKMAAERQAINAPLQGSSADIIKRAMILIDACIREQCVGARLLLQVHDEVVLEVPADKADAWEPLFREKMQEAAQLSVPLDVHSTMSSYWS